MKTMALQLLAVLMFAITGFFSLASAQVNQAWVKTINGPINGNDNAHDVAVDPSGNIYVTGWIEFSSGNQDYYTIKYSPEGDTLWTRRYGGAANQGDYGYAIAVDDAGNVYVTGQSVQSGSLFDLVTIKYNTNGDELWLNAWSGPTNYSSYGYSVAVDVSGNVYVTGFTSDGLTSGEFITIKYNESGSEQWAKLYKGPGISIDYGNCIAADDAGNSYVAGWSGGVNNLHDMTTIKYNPDGDTLWVRRYNGSADDNDYAYWLALDPSGNVFVTGQSVETGSDNDITTIKYSNDGDMLWIQHFNGSLNGYDAGQAVAVDADGNAYVTGNSTGSGGLNGITIKYSPSGDLLWSESFSGPGSGGDVLLTIALDDSANAYVSGFVSSGSASDIATVKYSTDGNLEWSQLYNGSGNSYDGSYAIAVDNNYSVILAAYSTGSGTGYDYTTIKYSQPVVPVELTSFTASGLNGSVLLKWSTASETNNRGFGIERTEGGNNQVQVNWIPIGFVEGNGTTTGRHDYSFSDDGLTAGVYKYRLKQLDFDGSFEYSPEVSVEAGAVPAGFTLSQNYPNPFNPATSISYSIPKDGFVHLSVYNVLGQQVKELINENVIAGNHQVTFNAANLSSGVYYYRIEAGGNTVTRKMILLR